MRKSSLKSIPENASSVGSYFDKQNRLKMLFYAVFGPYDISRADKG
jgi:hypothetical protein